MMNLRNSPATLLALCLLLPLTSLADRPADFEARLELYRNGKLNGETVFKLETLDGRWAMHSSTRGTKGVASWIGLKEQSTGEGDWHEGLPRPLRYDRNVKAVVTREWTAEFDWENDEDEIEDAHFRVSEVKSVDTPLGCMQTHVVEKVRGEGSSRYTRTYYASEHDFAPVLIEHGKTDGDRVEGRVISLTVAGKPVAAGRSCAP